MAESGTDKCGRGWNDPPPCVGSSTRATQSNPDATRRRLNKRVPIPMSHESKPIADMIIPNQIGEPPSTRPPLPPIPSNVPAPRIETSEISIPHRFTTADSHASTSTCLLDR